MIQLGDPSTAVCEQGMAVGVQRGHGNLSSDLAVAALSPVLGPVGRQDSCGDISALSLVLSVSFQAVASTMDFLWICLILLAVVLPEGSLADLEKQRMGSGLEICILSRSAMPLSRSHLRRSGNTCM